MGKENTKRFFCLLMCVFLMMAIGACGDKNDEETGQVGQETEETKDTYTYESEGGYSVELPNIYKEKVVIKPKSVEGGYCDEFYLKSQYEVDETGRLFSIYKRAIDQSDIIQMYGEDTVFGMTNDGSAFYGWMFPTDIQFDEEHQSDYEELIAFRDSIMATFDADDFVAGIVPPYNSYETQVDREPTYENLARYPDDFVGRLLNVSGNVFDVQENGANSVYLIHVSYVDGIWMDTFCIEFDITKSDGRILEGDNVTFSGTYQGLTTYINSNWQTVTVPFLKADYVTFN